MMAITRVLGRGVQEGEKTGGHLGKELVLW